ncbi:hypothetical protein CDAR_431331 [Caerostris darwini]|uniref:Uncharacterized protein n=1 Tax=Caerostris darwini TaxID=1538125 RepID=A0AAV4RPK4_9ARAC|nr:hypothetical protein CDAR_431331 [Caerostris darwini]
MLRCTRHSSPPTSPYRVPLQLNFHVVVCDQASAAGDRCCLPVGFSRPLSVFTGLGVGHTIPKSIPPFPKNEINKKLLFGSYTEFGVHEPMGGERIGDGVSLKVGHAPLPLFGWMELFLVVEFIFTFLFCDQ